MEIYREIKMRPPERSRAVAWIIRFVTLLAVVVIYVLSVPPLVFQTLTAQTAAKEGQPSPKMQSPGWVQLYAAPYDWVASSSLLRQPLDSYADWCAEKMQR